jgi:hypothetical protein
MNGEGQPARLARGGQGDLKTVQFSRQYSQYRRQTSADVPDVHRLEPDMGGTSRRSP